MGNITRGMVITCNPAVGFSVESDSRFFKSKCAFADRRLFLGNAELLGRFDSAMDTAVKWVATFTGADFARPSPERLQGFAPS